MSEHKQALAEIKNAVSQLPEEELARLNSAIEIVNNLLKTFGDIGMLAIAFIGASIASEQEDAEALANEGK